MTFLKWAFCCVITLESDDERWCRGFSELFIRNGSCSRGWNPEETDSTGETKNLWWRWTAEGWGPAVTSGPHTGLNEHEQVTGTVRNHYRPSTCGHHAVFQFTLKTFLSKRKNGVEWTSFWTLLHWFLCGTCSVSTTTFVTLRCHCVCVILFSITFISFEDEQGWGGGRDTEPF